MLGGGRGWGSWGCWIGISIIGLEIAEGSSSSLVRGGERSTGGTCGRWESDLRLLCRESLRSGSGRGRRQRGSGLGDGGVGRRLCACLGLLAVAIDVVLRLVQVESTKLKGSTLQLLAGCLWHAHGLLLVQEATLSVARGAGDGGTVCGSVGGGSESTVGGGLRSLMLCLGGGNRRGGRAGLGSSRIP